MRTTGSCVSCVWPFFFFGSSGSPLKVKSLSLGPRRCPLFFKTCLPYSFFFRTSGPFSLPFEWVESFHIGASCTRIPSLSVLFGTTRKFFFFSENRRFLIEENVFFQSVLLVLFPGEPRFFYGGLVSYWALSPPFSETTDLLLHLSFPTGPLGGSLFFLLPDDPSRGVS